MTEKGINLIKSFEGFRREAYLCPAGIPTIGYGTTKIGRIPVKLGMKINEVVALALLESDLYDIEDDVRQLVKVTLTSDQYSALVSFEYNTGGLARSTLLRKINGGLEISPSSFTMWNKATIDGILIELPGLTRRRMAEYNLYKGIDDASHS